MKTKRILTVLFALMMLVLAFSAQAATQKTQFLDTMDGAKYYNVDIPTSGSYGRIARHSATTLSVIEEDDGNYAFKLADGNSAKQQMIVYTYTNLAGDGYKNGEDFVKAPYVSAKAKIKLSSIEGTTQLFAMNRTFSKTLGNSTDTAGVYISNGGAYYYDFETSELVCFIEEGTLSANEWYTVEAVYDESVNENLKMCGLVYDAEGTLIGKSPLKQVSNLKWYSDKVRYTRSYIINTGYAVGEYALIDDVELYTLETTPVTCDSQTIAEDCSSAAFTFSDILDADTVTKDNITLEAVDSELDTSELYEVSYEDGVLNVEFGTLPFNQKFVLTVTTNVGVVDDAFGLTEDIVIEFTSPDDPLKTSMDTLTFANAEGGDIAAGSNVVVSMTLDNTTNAKREYMLLVTSWNSKNECVAIRCVHGFVEPGQKIEPLTAPAVSFEDEESVIRVSLIDNWLNMTPVGDAVTYQLGGN